MSRSIGALLFACLLACSLGQAARAQSLPPLAVYKGNSHSGRAGVPSFEAFMGRRVDAVGDFIDFASDQAFKNDVSYTAAGWKGYDRPLILAVPVLCRGETFADVAAGKMDARYVALAKAFNAAGVTLKVIRLGWEDNVQTTPGYASQDGAAHYANYKAAWTHLYGVLKPLLPHTLIVQDFAMGWQQVQQSDLFLPAVADGIGLTVYPQTWSAATAEPAFTGNLMTESWGLKGFGTWWPNKPIVITEYGVAGTRADGHGAPNGGDDPVWSKATLDLFKSWGSRVQGVVVWDFHAGDFNGLVSGGGFPDSGAVLKAEFAQAAATASPAPSAPAFTAKISPAGSVSVTPKADGSATLGLTFPPTAKPVTYTITLSELRKIGFGDGKGGLNGGLWAGGAGWGAFTWGSSGGTAQVYVAPK